MGFSIILSRCHPDERRFRQGLIFGDTELCVDQPLIMNSHRVSVTCLALYHWDLFELDLYNNETRLYILIGTNNSGGSGGHTW